MHQSRSRYEILIFVHRACMRERWRWRYETSLELLMKSKMIQEGNNLDVAKFAVHVYSANQNTFPNSNILYCSYCTVCYWNMSHVILATSARHIQLTKRLLFIPALAWKELLMPATFSLLTQTFFFSLCPPLPSPLILIFFFCQQKIVNGKKRI